MQIMQRLGCVQSYVTTVYTSRQKKTKWRAHLHIGANTISTWHASFACGNISPVKM